MATLEQTLDSISAKHDRLHDMIDIAPQTDKDRSARATNELVMDYRTRVVLQKLIKRGVIGSLHGCVSTGKEANVYFADAPTADTVSADVAQSLGISVDAVVKDMQARFPGGLAVKVFKTSILVFKDRDRYVTGEFRFRRGYARHNPRKMVRLWAEKELRNLHRMRTAGLPVPVPVAVKNNVLVMEFAGHDGWPSPRLKDAEGLDAAQWDALYVQCVKAMRTMFHVCRLVHADLSEFNMLYHAGQLLIIDVSQSVEHDHPHALEFLRSDCCNVTDFFGSKRCAGGLHTMSKVALFNFIVRPDVPADQLDDLIDAGRREYSALLEAERDPLQRESREAHEWKVAEAAFLRSYIPRTLMEVVDCERDIFNPERAPPMLYSSVTGLPDKQQPLQPLCLDSDSDDDDDDDGDDGKDEGDEEEEEEEDDGDEDEEEDEEDEEDDEEEEGGEEKAKRKKEHKTEEQRKAEKEQKKQERKEHKKQVKAERRVRRKEKAARKQKEKEKRKARNKQQSKPMGR